LLRSALRWFARQGFEGTSLRALAAEAGVDMALVGRLYGSKAELWDAVISHLAERQIVQRATLAEITTNAASDPAEAFRAFLRHFAQVSYEMPEFPSLLVHETANPGPRLDAILTRLVFPFRQECEAILVAAENAGVIRVSNREVFFGMLLAAIAMPMVSPSMFSEATTVSEELRDRIAHEAIGIFVR
jgi:AcrR family transcriptional regulator